MRLNSEERKALRYFGLTENFNEQQLESAYRRKESAIVDYYNTLKVYLAKKECLKKVVDNYFYGINFNEKTITSFKGFINNKNDILNAFNSKRELDKSNLIEKSDIEALIIYLNGEYKLLEDCLVKARTSEDIVNYYNNFRKRCSILIAEFYNDLLKKIKLSTDIKEASELFNQLETVGHALVAIYQDLYNRFEENKKSAANNGERDSSRSKESTEGKSEKDIKKDSLSEYIEYVNDHFERGSDEYKKAFAIYQKMFATVNSTTLEEFMDIFERAYYDIQREVETKKGNIK